MSTATWIAKFFMWVEQQEKTISELQHHIIALKSTQHRQQNEIENLYALSVSKNINEGTASPSRVKPTKSKEENEKTNSQTSTNGWDENNATQCHSPKKSVGSRSLIHSKPPTSEPVEQIENQITIEPSDSNGTCLSDSNPLLFAAKRRKYETKEWNGANEEPHISTQPRIHRNECDDDPLPNIAKTLNASNAANANGNEKDIRKSVKVMKELTAIQRCYVALMKSDDESETKPDKLQRQLDEFVAMSETILRRIEQNKNDICISKDVNTVLAYCHALVGNALYHRKIKHELLAITQSNDHDRQQDHLFHNLAHAPHIVNAFAHARQAIQLHQAGYRGWVLLAELTCQCQRNLNASLEILDKAALCVKEKNKILSHRDKLLLKEREKKKHCEKKIMSETKIHEQYENLKLKSQKIELALNESLKEVKELLIEWREQLPEGFWIGITTVLANIQDKFKYIITPEPNGLQAYNEHEQKVNEDKKHKSGDDDDLEEEMVLFEFFLSLSKEQINRVSYTNAQ
ncbi:hypothetical protein RFI_29029 [Reticulomyxa filosa]|uniref:Uncharacterized protein n=1 Tax=Reticulomyxa filosa TaxID=46433 RepID=X6M5S7_RETFI|nr:hypothetical protein RFI_29029 [Reticulomyxa filosa]|eukprot:ETO08360.1 hypothetical protein RFI_29029 [Reticulomyxa filosa]